MKNITIGIFILVLLSCRQEYKIASEPFPTKLYFEPDWIAYEGVLPFENDRPLNMELELRPGSVGENGYYRFKTWSDESNGHIMAGWYGNGSYTVLYGGPNERIIQFKISRYILRHNKKPLTEERELAFKINGDHELILLDNNLDMAVPSHRLIRRSKLFTVEGYITFEKDTADFFERNTMEKWVVSRLASYPEVRDQYQKLAKERFEGIYVKALAYSVTQVDNSGKETDALVLKKIVTMNADH